MDLRYVGTYEALNDIMGHTKYTLLRDFAYLVDKEFAAANELKAQALIVLWLDASQRRKARKGLPAIEDGARVFVLLPLVRGALSRRLASTIALIDLVLVTAECIFAPPTILRRAGMRSLRLSHFLSSIACVFCCKWRTLRS